MEPEHLLSPSPPCLGKSRLFRILVAFVQQPQCARFHNPASGIYTQHIVLYTYWVEKTDGCSFPQSVSHTAPSLSHISDYKQVTAHAQQTWRPQLRADAEWAACNKVLSVKSPNWNVSQMQRVKRRGPTKAATLVSDVETHWSAEAPLQWVGLFQPASGRALSACHIYENIQSSSWSVAAVGPILLVRPGFTAATAAAAVRKVRSCWEFAWIWPDSFDILWLTCQQCKILLLQMTFSDSGSCHE